MTIEQLNLLSKFAGDNNISMFTLTCIFHIAAKEAAKQHIIRDYGIVVCEELRQLENEMNNTQIKWFYQI